LTSNPSHYNTNPKQQSNSIVHTKMVLIVMFHHMTENEKFNWSFIHHIFMAR